LADRQEQEEQFEDEHPEQPEPVDPEDLNLYPEENPKEDIFFLGPALPHFGQFTDSSVLKTMHSKSSPHFSHVYS